MSIFKKIICMLLVVCFLGAALIGCSKKNKNNDDNDDASEGQNSVSTVTEKPTNEYGEPSFTSAIPTNDLDFEGEELVMLIRDNIQNTREWYKASPEDELDEAIAMRNEACMEALNVKIEFELVPSATHGEYISALNSMITTDVNADLHYYDIGCNFSYYCTSVALRDYSANLLDTEQFPYFDFSLPCWNQAIVEDTTFNGQLFYVAGDANISMFDSAMIIWHNKTLYDKKKEKEDPENMQDVALAGQWTYEELYRWTSRFYVDSNGESGRQKNDTYALMAFVGDPCPRDAFPYAWDLEFVIENNDGTHSFNIVGNQKIEDALTKCRNLLRGEGTSSDASAHNFAAGCAIFYMERLYSSYESNMAIREMDDKYGILPMPKYDIEQEEYGTTAQDYYTLMFVLDHSKNDGGIKGEAISAFLQLATEESYTGVRGYYFNRIIKPKFFGTDDSEGTVTKSIALFDVIVANIKFDYCYIYSMQLENINHLWRGATAADEDRSLSALYNERKQAFEEAITKTDAWFGLVSIDE